jgi:phosphatidylserine/phosphatidylglycerophosphate/cardiolipin synthase-like enzyme
MGCSASTVTSGGRGGSSRGQILLFGRISRPMPEAVSPPLAGLAHLVGRATGQSLTGGNRIEPLVDGEQAYPAMLAAIESARKLWNLCFTHKERHL